jgi:hypothetical protein
MPEVIEMRGKGWENFQKLFLELPGGECGCKGALVIHRNFKIVFGFQREYKQSERKSEKEARTPARSSSSRTRHVTRNAVKEESKEGKK